VWGIEYSMVIRKNELVRKNILSATCMVAGAAIYDVIKSGISGVNWYKILFIGVFSFIAFSIIYRKQS
jgi:hypothetical protein